jgi:hypothetical protein
MSSNPGKQLAELESDWRAREMQWARKLGRLRLGVEPLEEQLARYRRTTWALVIVPAGIALIFFALFTAFNRPEIGLLVVLILFAPMVLFASADYAQLRRRAAAYLADRARFEEERKRLLEDLARPAAPR